MYKHEESKHPHKIIKYRLERWLSAHHLKRKYEDFRLFPDSNVIGCCSVALVHFKPHVAAIVSKNNWDYRCVPLHPVVDNPKPRDTGKLKITLGPPYYQSGD